MSRKSLAIVGVLVLTALPAGAQKTSIAPETHCDPSFTGSDIGASFPGQSNGIYVTASSDCTGVPGCDDYFDIACAGGETITVSFCNGGGTADFDTGLSTWDSGLGPVFLDCDDDTCAQLSDLTTVLPSTPDTYRVRIGAFGAAGGTYTVAFRAPASCSILGVVPVTLQSVEVQ